MYRNKVQSKEALKTVIVNGQNHKGSTYTIARKLAEKISANTENITEFFLPRDFSQYCTGCTLCFTKDKKLCPHYEEQRKILEALDKADVMIFASPVYVYHVTAPMKNFLDHQGHRWMIHRPEVSMFKKQAVCISTAAGSGTKSTCRDMKDSMFFWGVGKIYSLGYSVHAVNWKSIDQKLKDRIEKDTDRLSLKITGKAGKVKPGIKTRGMFNIMRSIQLHAHGLSEADIKYWNDMGWTKKNRPWK